MATAQMTKPGDDIRLKLSDSERKLLGDDLLQKITKAREGMEQMLGKMRHLDNLYESELPAKDHPFPDGESSNINLPIIQSHTDTIHANVNDVILSVRPITKVSPPPFAASPDARSIAQKVEAGIEHIQVNQMDLPNAADTMFLAALRNPAGIAKLAWREEYRTVRMWQETVDELGMVQRKQVAQPVIKYRGPKLEQVNLRNFVIYPLTAETVDDAYLVGDRYRLTKEQVRAKVESGAFDDNALTLVEGSENSRTQDTEDEHQDTTEGIERTDFGEIWFWEVIAPYAVQKGKLPDDCVFTVEAETGLVVRATQFPYMHGQRYYIRFVPYPRPNRFFGRSLPQILEHCQMEANSVHNQRVDATKLTISKPFTTRKSAEINADSVILMPGANIPVDDHDDIRELPINPIVPGIDIEQYIRDYAERASGVNDIATGKQSEGDKTLGELRMVQARTGVRFSDVIRRLQGSMVEVADQTRWLMYQFMDDAEIAQITDGLTKDALIQEWDFIPHGNMGTADKFAKKNDAVFLYNTLVGGPKGGGNPLVMQNPLRVYRLTQQLLQEFGIQDVENFIGTEEELQMQMQQAAIMAQEQAMAQQQMMAEQQGMAQQQMMMEQQNRQQDRQAAVEDRDAGNATKLAIAQMGVMGRGGNQ